jgi:hypothetical protein
MKKKKKTYYLYHVPGIKVGMTTSIYRRVIKDQGYKPGEFIVVDSSTNKSLIEVKEVLLQKHYGYPVDKDTYDQSGSRL